MNVITTSAEQTKAVGMNIAKTLQGGETLALVGALGSGKTTFVQGLAKGLGITQRIVSPTFIIMRRYPLKNVNFYHVDLYRLEHNVEHEIKSVGLGDIWGKEDAIVAIEWAEKIRQYFPKKGSMWITFERLEDNSHKISIDKT